MARTTTMQGVEQLNSLLRGEISAAETYAQAIRKVGEDHVSDATQLRAIAQEHGEHAQLLREQIRRLGGEPEDSSSAWGVYAKTIEGVAKLFGDTSALKALKEGEEHGLKDYRDALKDVDESSRQLIAEALIPAQQRHITTLDAMMNRIER
jgi:uncharacterized protein (TIGR02284 family)